MRRSRRGRGWTSVGASGELWRLATSNWNASTATHGKLRVGVNCKKGDIPAGSKTLELYNYDTSTSIATSVSKFNKWSDGSLKWGVLHGDIATLNASATRNISVRAIDGNFATPRNAPGYDVVAWIQANTDFTLAITSLVGSKTGAMSSITPSLNTMLNTVTRWERRVHNDIVTELVCWGVASAASEMIVTRWDVTIWHNAGATAPDKIEITPSLKNTWFVNNPFGTVRNAELYTMAVAFKNGAATIWSGNLVLHRHTWVPIPDMVNEVDDVGHADLSSHCRQWWYTWNGSALSQVRDTKWWDLANVSSWSYWMQAGALPPLNQSIWGEASYTGAYGSYGKIWDPEFRDETAGRMFYGASRANCLTFKWAGYSAGGSWNGRHMLPRSDILAIANMDAAHQRYLRTNAMFVFARSNHFTSHLSRTRLADSRGVGKRYEDNGTTSDVAETLCHAKFLKYGVAAYTADLADYGFPPARYANVCATLTSGIDAIWVTERDGLRDADFLYGGCHGGDDRWWAWQMTSEELQKESHTPRPGMLAVMWEAIPWMIDGVISDHLGGVHWGSGQTDTNKRELPYVGRPAPYDNATGYWHYGVGWRGDIRGQAFGHQRLHCPYYFSEDPISNGGGAYICGGEKKLVEKYVDMTADRYTDILASMPPSQVASGFSPEVYASTVEVTWTPNWHENWLNQTFMWLGKVSEKQALTNYSLFMCNSYTNVINNYPLRLGGYYPVCKDADLFNETTNKYYGSGHADAGRQSFLVASNIKYTFATGVFTWADSSSYFPSVDPFQDNQRLMGGVSGKIKNNDRFVIHDGVYGLYPNHTPAWPTVVGLGTGQVFHVVQAAGDGSSWKLSETQGGAPVSWTIDIGSGPETVVSVGMISQDMDAVTPTPTLTNLNDDSDEYPMVCPLKMAKYWGVSTTAIDNAVAAWTAATVNVTYLTGDPEVHYTATPQA